MRSAVEAWSRLQCRKVFVAGSTVLLGVGMVLVAHASSVETCYVAESAMGLAYGIYLAVAQALVVDVADHLLAS